MILKGWRNKFYDYTREKKISKFKEVLDNDFVS